MPITTIPKARVHHRLKTGQSYGYLHLHLKWNGLSISYPLTKHLASLKVSSIPRKEWDKKKGELKALGKDREKINRHNAINAQLTAIKRHIEKFQQNNPTLTKERLKTELDYYTGKQERPTADGQKRLNLFEFIDKFIMDKKAEGKNYRTCQKYQAVKNHLTNYAKNKKIVLGFDSINKSFRDDFIKWCYTKPREHSINTVSKTLEVIKLFMREAFDDGHHTNKFYEQKGFVPTRNKDAKTKNKPRLTFEELSQLQRFVFDTDRLTKVRDLFIVGSFTGLRFGDWHKVNKSNIIVEEGTELLQIFTQKTKELVYIPLLPELKAVLEKYNYQLPKISLTNFNDYIKEACNVAGINSPFLRIYNKSGKSETQNLQKWEKVSSHSARRSFATNFYELGVPPSILMQITAHTTQKQFFEYIAIDQKKSALKFARMAAINAAKRQTS